MIRKQQFEEQDDWKPKSFSSGKHAAKGALVTQLVTPRTDWVEKHIPRRSGFVHLLRSIRLSLANLTRGALCSLIISILTWCDDVREGEG